MPDSGDHRAATAFTRGSARLTCSALTISRPGAPLSRARCRMPSRVSTSLSSVATTYLPVFLWGTPRSAHAATIARQGV